MRREIPTTKEEIICDICGKQTEENYFWLVILKDDENISEYGNSYTHTGDWCKECKDRIVYIISKKLNECAVERYEMDHSGKNKTIDFYKDILTCNIP